MANVFAILDLWWRKLFKTKFLVKWQTANTSIHCFIIVHFTNTLFLFIFSIESLNILYCKNCNTASKNIITVILKK